MRTDRRKVVVVIPAYNEESTIKETVSYFRSMGVPCVVSDDGSSDQTRVEAANGGAIVRNSSVNHGIAWATQRGIIHAMWFMDPLVIVTMDAGGSHSPQDFWKLVQTLEEGADIAIGSRFIEEAKYEGGRAWRKTLSRAYGICMGFACHSKVKDWTSGYRAYRAPTWNHLADRGFFPQGTVYLAKGHAWQAEVLANANVLGLDIREVPISYKAGRSSFRIKSALEAWQVLTHAFFHIGGPR